MRLGRTDFGTHIKRWTFKKFKDTYSGNKAVLRDLSAHGYSLESAYEKLTGKKPEKDVPKVSDKDKKD